MQSEIVQSLTENFEAHAQTTDSGVEYWLARDLQYLLGYAEWRNFTTVVSRAKTACEVSGHAVADHFVDVNKMVDLGSGARREIDDVMLTRFACYLIAQNGDPSKAEIAFAQAYFAVQTRRAELIEQRLLESERLAARRKLTHTEKELSSLIFEQTGGNQDFALIRSKGDHALFGRTTQEMKAVWKVPAGRPLADFAPTIVLKAKDFAAEITIFNAREHTMRTEASISKEHVTNNAAVRNTLLERGIRPERLPAEEDLKKVERRLASEDRKIPGSARHPRWRGTTVTTPRRSPASPKTVESLRHPEERRANIPTAEYQSVVSEEVQSPIRVAIERRNRDLDPQLVWRGKDEQDERDLEVWAPPLYIQEKVHPKALIDDLLRESKKGASEPDSFQQNFFADFNGVPEGVDKTDFYKHDANWTNRMILGDSLQVMSSLAEREGLRGKVQCIYIDPPYGIKFNSNFQWSTTSRDVKDGNAGHITREPEQVKAFRDTWRDGIHSYLSYLRDRLLLARELLTDSGSVFVQIGNENLHRVRALLDEIFGDANFKSVIHFVSNSGLAQSGGLATVGDYVLWYAKDSDAVKYRQSYIERPETAATAAAYSMVELDGGNRRAITQEEKRTTLSPGARRYRYMDISKPGPGSKYEIEFRGRLFLPGKRWWGTTPDGIARLKRADRLDTTGTTLWQIKYYNDFPFSPITNLWDDTASSFAADKVYIVQTNTKIVQRCLLMTTDPGDLVLDPTCGSGTTSTVAEQWGRRWITIDTSRVALALARARIMGARYPYYLLADSNEGQQKEAEVTRSAPSTQPVTGNVRHGFVYERVPHITLKSIVNNAEIDVIWEKWEQRMEPTRRALSVVADVESKAEPGRALQEWEVPRECPATWPEEAKSRHAEFWELRLARQKEIDASIAAKAEFEYLYDRPYEDKKTVRVAGPFTVESVSPHRMLAVDEHDELFDTLHEEKDAYDAPRDFNSMILENLKLAGVQQAHKEDRISFSSLTPWPGRSFICAEAKYSEGETGREVRAGIFVGPEFGTVSRMDLVEAAKEAGDAGFDVVIACAFNYDAHSAEFEKLGRIPILKARMNADLHMADDLKNTGKGNLFVIFGEPDVDILPAGEGGEPDQIRVQVNGVDVFHPQSGEVRSDGPDGIACWFIDTDYNGESFFVRHAYFLGQNDPYKSLKTSLKAEINEDAWDSLHSAISRPFDKPTSGKIAVKIINHLGDEVMKVFGT